LPAEIYRRIFIFMAYSDLLKDPRWQRKRLEILERDDFTCQKCYETTKTLHVHHKVYSKQKVDPWTYADNVLITLCEDCHQSVSDNIKESIHNLGESLKLAGFFPDHIDRISNAFRDAKLMEHPSIISVAISIALTNPDAQKKMIDSYYQYLADTFNG